MANPPTCIEGAEEDCHVRNDLRLDVSTGEPLVFMSVSRYRFGSEEPVHTYFETSFLYDPQYIVGMVDAIWFGVDVAADFSGAHGFYIGRAPRQSLSTTDPTEWKPIRTSLDRRVSCRC